MDAVSTSALKLAVVTSLTVDLPAAPSIAILIVPVVCAPLRRL